MVKGRTLTQRWATCSLVCLSRCRTVVRSVGRATPSVGDREVERSSQHRNLDLLLSKKRQLSQLPWSEATIVQFLQSFNVDSHKLYIYMCVYIMNIHMHAYLFIILLE